MKGFWNVIRHKYFAAAATIMIIFLPLVLVINQQQQELRGKAEASTSLSFLPASASNSPILKKVGDYFYLDLMLNPGKNQVSLVKLDVIYDPTKVELVTTNPFVVNSTIFPQIVEGPVYSSGRIQIVLSVGSDLSKSISTQSRVATLNFIAKGTSSQTLVSYGANNQIFSVASGDASNENVLSTTTPAYLSISKAAGGKGGGGKGGGGKPSK